MTLFEWVSTWWRRATPVSERRPALDPIQRPTPAVPAEWLSLYTYLEHRYASTVVLTFAQLETLLGRALPEAARTEHVDTNQTFTLIVHVPATTEPSHRDRDVRATHAGELGQFVVTHRHGDRLPAADAGPASARCGQTKQQPAEPLLRPAMRHHLDSMLGVCQPQAQREHQRVKRRAVLVQVAQEVGQLDFERFTLDQSTGRGSPNTGSNAAQAQLAEGLVRLNRA